MHRLLAASALVALASAAPVAMKDGVEARTDRFLDDLADDVQGDDFRRWRVGSGSRVPCVSTSIP